MKDFTYCASMDKVEGLCEKCKRNIDLSEVTATTWLSEDWKPKEVKNLKTKMKCEWFVDGL